MDLTIHLLNASESEKACRELTYSLPEYFGIQEANERYAKGVRELLTFGAELNGIYVGLISLEMPFPNNANIYWMAVKKEYHGQGIGCSLLKYAEAYCSKKQCASMTVETLSPAEKDPNYIKIEFLESSLAAQGRLLVVMDRDELKDDLVQDMIEVLTSFCARLYGRRSAKNRAKKALECIQSENQ